MTTTTPAGFISYSTRPVDHDILKALDPANPLRFVRVYADGRWTAHASKYKNASVIASGVEAKIK